MDARRPLGDDEERHDLEARGRGRPPGRARPVPRGPATTGRTIGVEQRDQDDGDGRRRRSRRRSSAAGATRSPGTRRRDDERDDQALHQRHRTAAPLPEHAQLRRRRSRAVGSSPRRLRCSPSSIPQVRTHSIGCRRASSITAQSFSAALRWVHPCRPIADPSRSCSTDRMCVDPGRTAAGAARRTR